MMLLDARTDKAVCMNTGTNFTQISATCSRHPLEFTGMFHTRDLTCQQSPK